MKRSCSKSGLLRTPKSMLLWASCFPMSQAFRAKIRFSRSGKERDEEINTQKLKKLKSVPRGYSRTAPPGPILIISHLLSVRNASRSVPWGERLSSCDFPSPLQGSLLFRFPTPGWASLARGYSLAALPGRRCRTGEPGKSDRTALPQSASAAGGRALKVRACQ